MKAIIKNLKGSIFIRNIMIVASGTAMAQIITFLAAPIITRLYGPEAFGIMAVFKSVIGIIGPVAALTFPIAIILPKDDRDAKTIGKLSLITAGLVALITAIILFFFEDDITKTLNIEEVQPYLFLIPLAIFFAAYEQIAKQWLVRTRQFKVTAKSSIINAFILNGLKVCIGFFKPVSSVLILLSAFGSFIFGSILMVGAIKSNHQVQITNQKPLKIKQLIKQYSDFPLFRSPQVLLNAFSQNLPVLFLTFFFSPISAGFYSLGMTVLALPTRLIGKSISDVLYPKINEAYSNGSNIANLLIKTTFGLLVVGIFPFGLIVVYGPGIFSFVFGEEWHTTGEYARWLALGTFFSLLSRPSVVVIPILKLQGKFLLFEIVSTIFLSISFIIGYYFFKSDITSIVSYSITLVSLQAFFIGWIIYSCKK